MKKFAFLFLRYSGLPFLFREIIQRRRVTILIFHDLKPAAAEKAFAYLIKHYAVIDLDRLLLAIERKDPRTIPRKALIVTFDDGLKELYLLLPSFKKFEITATVFLCSGIVGTNKHFWFRFKSRRFSLSDLKELPTRKKIEILKKEGFDLDEDREIRQALSAEEIEEMKPWVNFQSHTMYHHRLTRSSNREAENEIRKSKEKLESDFGLSIDALAYPLGAYSEREIRLAKSAGYRCALTEDPGFNNIRTDPYRLRRLVINDADDFHEFIVRASGVWAFLRMIPIGAKRLADFSLRKPPKHS